jgi:hypothetical protein
MVAFLGFYAAAELSHFVEIVPRVPVSAVKFVRWYLGYGLFRTTELLYSSTDTDILYCMYLSATVLARPTVYCMFCPTVV